MTDNKSIQTQAEEFREEPTLPLPHRTGYVWPKAVNTQ